MTSNYKCFYCERYFSTRNAHSQHTRKCIANVESIEESNEMSIDNEDFSITSEFQDIQEERYPGDNSFDEMSQLSNFSENYENFNEFEILFENLQSDNKESKNISKLEEINEFPNEAYGDLMKLVIENNLSNKAGNTFIKFFK